MYFRQKGPATEEDIYKTKSEEKTEEIEPEEALDEAAEKKIDDNSDDNSINIEKIMYIHSPRTSIWPKAL
ncbi:MAG: hypothetical protein KGY68_05720 [Candidatus Thermoplasmatota archaeon]|nr:hypothetical protein [Candidatus Thermoplasmatota archaeon]